MSHPEFPEFQLMIKNFQNQIWSFTSDPEFPIIIQNFHFKPRNSGLSHWNALPLKFENEMHVDWNGPKVGKADTIISEALNTYFKSENWHFMT